MERSEIGPGVFPWQSSYVLTIHITELLVYFINIYICMEIPRLDGSGFMTYLGACAGPGWIFRSAAFVGRAIFLSLFPPHASALESFAARLESRRTTDKPIKRYDRPS
jgi:hypothetical protein